MAVSPPFDALTALPGIAISKLPTFFDKLKNQPMNDIYVMIQRAMDDPEYAKLMTKPINRLTNEDALNMIDFIARAGLIAQPLSIDSSPIY